MTNQRTDPSTAPAAGDRFRQLAEWAPVGIVETDLHGDVLYANDRWREITGIATVTPFAYAIMRDIVWEPDRDRIDGMFRQATGGLTEFDITTRVARPDASLCHVRLQGAPTLGTDGKATGFVGSLMDLTELVEARDAKSRSEQRYRDLIASAPVGQAVYEITGELVEVNRAWAGLLGYEPDEVIGTQAAQYVHPDDRPSVLASGPRLLKGEIAHLLENRRLLRKDGSSTWVSSSITVERDLDGRAVLFHSLIIDVNDRMLATEALRDNEARYRSIIDSLHDGLIVHTADGVLAANASAARILGVDQETVVDPAYLTALDVFDANGVAIPLKRRPSVVTLLTGEPSYGITQGLDTPSGDRIWFVTNTVPLFHEGDDQPYAVALSFADITERKAAQEQNDRLANIVESTSDLVGVVDWTTGKMVYLNRAARELFGYVDADVSDIHHLSLFTEDAVEIVVNSLEPAMRRGDVWSGEMPMIAADGSVLQVWQSIAAERLPDGTITQLSAVARDVTDRRRFEEELAWQATHDSHTGLPNRALLLDHLELGLARAERDGRLIALLFLDLDRFKQVNDSLGHEVGDELLVQAAQRLTSVLRPSDIVARIGGDEFVVLAMDVDDEDHAIAIGQRVAAAIGHAPFVLADQSFDVTASIGIAISRGNDAEPETMLRDADAAMYRAKDLGRARLEVFDESMHARAERRNTIANQLASGIERDEIAVYYQPCIDLATGRITAVEALARWAHPDRGVLSPYEFIALAEDTGLIVGLGLSVLSKACHQAQSWSEHYGADAPRVHVNLSARQLMSRNLPTLVEGVLGGTRLPAGHLCLEITESVLMEDAASVIDTLWALKAIGVSLAIDDFGTGYSSLSYLRKFPVDVLKVDQSFVDGLGPDPEDTAIVAAIINLAASLELDAVAEGVETTEQLERLRSLGCNSAQGFLFSEPRPAHEIERLFGTVFEI